MKIPTKVFLTSDIIRVLDDRARRTKRQKSEIVRAAVEAYLSPDSAEAGEAALSRRLDRMSRQLDRLERDVTIANEAIGLFVKTWLKVTPAMSAVEDRAASAKGQERYAAFIDLLSRRISEGRLLRGEVLSDVAGEEQSWRELAGYSESRSGGRSALGAESQALRPALIVEDRQ